MKLVPISYVSAIADVSFVQIHNNSSKTDVSTCTVGEIRTSNCQWPASEQLLVSQTAIKLALSYITLNLDSGSSSRNMQSSSKGSWDEVPAVEKAPLDPTNL